jgi:hypothetical protein
MLQIDARSVSFGREADVDLGRRVPVWGFPGEHDACRRGVRGHDTHIELFPVREALEEAPTFAALPDIRRFTLLIGECSQFSSRLVRWQALA